MFTADDEEILIVFKILCQQYPNENATALWETAGGKTSRTPYAPDAGESASSQAFPTPEVLSDLEGLS